MLSIDHLACCHDAIFLPDSPKSVNVNKKIPNFKNFLFLILSFCCVQILKCNYQSMFYCLRVITVRNEGNIFTGICDSVHGGAGLPQCMLGYHTPRTRQAPPKTRQAPPSRTRQVAHWNQTGTPGTGQAPPGTRQAPPGTSPPQSRTYWEILTTSGRYASYWNAILLTKHVSMLH